MGAGSKCPTLLNRRLTQSSLLSAPCVKFNRLIIIMMYTAITWHKNAITSVVLNKRLRKTYEVLFAYPAVKWVWVPQPLHKILLMLLTFSFFKNGLNFVNVVVFNHFLKFVFVKSSFQNSTPQIFDLIIGRVVGEYLTNLKLLLSSPLILTLFKSSVHHWDSYSIPYHQFRCFRLQTSV